jgi:hypothetical protein
MDGRYAIERRLLLAVPLALAMASVLAPASALAASEPSGNASCMGLELASISPPGSSDEEPGGARQFVSEVKDLAVFLGVKPGALFSFIASLHAGSHADCDEALEG